MKTISQNLHNHLQQEVTTLTTCWKLTRTDGVSLYFTDHDRDIVYDGETYLAATGYTRTALDNTADLAVDNMDMLGILDAEAITVQDLRLGLYDYAYIEVFILNWAEVSQGPLKLRSGRLGEVIITQSGEFKAELRGLSQNLSQTIVELYSPSCRADLGDARCGVVLDAPEWQPEQAYTVGDLITTRTQMQNPGPVIMPGLEAESSDLEALGWKSEEQAVFDSYSEVNSGKTSPYVGNWLIWVANRLGAYLSSSCVLTHSLQTLGLAVGNDIQLVGALGTPYEDPDEIYTQAALAIHALDAGGAYLGGESTEPKHYPDLEWHEESTPVFIIPENTAYLSVHIFAQHPDNTPAARVVADGLRLYSTATGALGPWPVQFRCTQAGISGASEPAWPQDPGLPAADGTAQWVAVLPQARAGEVVDVLGIRQFSCNFLEADQTLYPGGRLVWESGLNAGRTSEVCSLPGALVTLYLPPRHPVQAGDSFTVYPGCDKTLATCRDRYKNAVNFRGEPYIPGMDEFLQYPDAK